MFLVEPAVSGVFDPEDGQQTRIDKIIGTVQDTADTAIGSINKTASDAVDSIGKAEASINESVTAACGPRTLIRRDGVRERDPRLHFQVVDWCCSFRAMV